MHRKKEEPSNLDRTPEINIFNMKNTLVFYISAILLCACASGGPDIVIVNSPDKLHCDDTVAVYSPSGMKNLKDIKTVFLLHGWSDSWSKWGRETDMQKLADDTGWRIINPDGFYDSWYFDNADPRKMQWRTSFWTEIWPELDERYGLKPDRTFITGLSMGGHGAMNIFLDHPERFAGAGSMSGVLDLGATKERFPVWEIVGKSSIEEIPEYSAINRLEAFKAGNDHEGKLLAITCGSEDGDSFVDCSTAFAQKCDALGLKYIFMLSPGGHNWKYWPYIIYYHLGWFDEQME